MTSSKYLVDFTGFGGPRRTRTYNLRIRNPTFYPVELEVHFTYVFYIGFSMKIPEKFFILKFDFDVIKRVNQT